MKPSIEGPIGSSESRLATLMSAAGDPLRLRILALVRERPLNVAEICDALEAAQPRVSHHLAILRRSGLLEVEVQGRQRFYRWPIVGSAGPGEDLRRFLDRWLTGAGTREMGGSPAPAHKSPSSELEDFLL